MIYLSQHSKFALLVLGGNSKNNTQYHNPPRGLGGYKGAHMHLMIEAATPAELKKKIEELAAFWGVTPNAARDDAQLPLPLGNMAADTAAPKPRARKAAKAEVLPAEKPAPAAALTVVEPATPLVVETNAPTEAPSVFAQIKHALQQVNEVQGMDAVMGLLSSFKDKDGKPCSRISAVLEADYPKFIEACSARLTQKSA